MSARIRHRPEPAGMSVSDAVAYSSLSRTKLYGMMSPDGPLKFSKVGRRRIVNVESLRRLIAPADTESNRE